MSETGSDENSAISWLDRYAYIDLIGQANLLEQSNINKWLQRHAYTEQPDPPEEKLCDKQVGIQRTRSDSQTIFFFVHFSPRPSIPPERLDDLRDCLSDDGE